MKNFSILILWFLSLCDGNARKVDVTFFKWQPIQFYKEAQLDSICKIAGEETVFNAFQASLRTHNHFDWSDNDALQQYITQAESFFQAQPIIQRAIGDEMLNVLADTLQTAIREQTVEADAPIIATILKRLSNNKKHIDIKMSNLKKTWNYLKAGRFDYVYFKMTTTYKHVSLWGLLFAFLGWVGFMFRKRIINRFQHKKQTDKLLTEANLSKNALIMPLILVLIGTSCAQKPVPLCELLKLEQQINETEYKIQQQIKGIPESFKQDLPISVYPSFKSVWDVYDKMYKPSEKRASDPAPCEKILLESYVKQGLNSRLQQAKANLAAVEKVQKKAVSFPAADDDPVVNTIEDSEIFITNPVTTKQESNELAKRVSITNDAAESVEMMASVKHSMSLPYTKNENDYACFIVNPHSKKVKIDFLWKDSNRLPLRTFGHSIELLKHQHKKPLMLMNAGIFGANNTPLGSFWSNGTLFHKFNEKSGGGNFYMDPAGIFIIDKKGNATIPTKEAYLEHYPDLSAIPIKHATQSGPMLVIKGEIHPSFNAHSNNRHIRNGVGVMADGNIVFVMSKQPVTFYEFATVFRERFKCQNALYLDGAISQMYVPKLNLNSIGGDFAGIIAVSEVEENESH